MKNIVKVIIALVFLFSGSIAESKDFLVDPAIGSTKKISSNKLKNIAIEQEVIPDIVTNDLLQRWQENGESVLIWIVSSREDKIKLVEGLKSIHQANEINIEKDSRYFVNKINLVIFENVRKGNAKAVRDKGVVSIFRDIAIMEGLYDNNMSIEETLKNHLGEKGFEKYKQKYPSKYKEMLSGSKAVN